GRGQRHPRPRRRAGHGAHGRARDAHADHLRHHGGGDVGDRRRAAVLGVLQQGRNFMECVRWRIPSPGCDRAARGLPHGVLYGAPLLHDVLRRVPRLRGRAAPHPRVARGDDAAARGARRPRLRGQWRGPRRLGDQRGLAALPDRQRAALRALLPRRRAGAPRLLGDALMLLTLVVFSPLAGAALLALLPREEVRGIRRAALAFALVTLVLSLVMLRRFQVGVANFQMAEQVAWIPQWGIDYRLGVDGVSLFLVLLTTVLTPIVVLASWGDIHRRVKEFFAFLLVLETGMLGTLVAL